MSNQKFTATAVYSNTSLDVSSDVNTQWNVSDESVASIDASGLVTSIPVARPSPDPGTVVYGSIVDGTDYVFSSYGVELADPYGPGQIGIATTSQFWEIHTPVGGNVEMAVRREGDTLLPYASLHSYPYSYSDGILGIQSRLWLYSSDGTPLMYNSSVHVTMNGWSPPTLPWGGGWSYLSTSLSPDTSYFIEVSYNPSYWTFSYQLQFYPDSQIVATLQTTKPSVFLPL